jgi:hypothetical protein
MKQYILFAVDVEEDSCGACKHLEQAKSLDNRQDLYFCHLFNRVEQSKRELRRVTRCHDAEFTYSHHVEGTIEREVEKRVTREEDSQDDEIIIEAQIFQKSRL